MTEIETRRVCVLPAAHLTVATWRMLHETPNAEWPLHGGRMGPDMLCVWAPTDMESHELPPDLVAALTWARQQGADPRGPQYGFGFDYVMFDRDCDNAADGLPLYDDGEEFHAS